AVRVVQVREPVSVTGGGESSPVGVSGVDGFFGFGGGVGWGRGLAAEGGGEENGEGVAWAHSASPLGEGEENTGAAERWQAATGPSQLGESSSFAPAVLRMTCSLASGRERRIVGAQHAEIGRASCRERVEVWVGAGALERRVNLRRE